MRASRAVMAMCCLLSGVAFAQNVPDRVTFNARLSDATGAPLVGPRGLTFRLFSTATGGSAVWSESHPSVSFATDGVATVVLGSTAALNPTILDGSALFLEIQVDTTTLTPRIGVVSVPYAIRASTAGTAAVATRLGALQETDVQRRVTGTCAAGAVTAINADGTVTCGGGTAAPLASCRAILQASASAANGIYVIDPDGAGPKLPVQTYCDMTTNGGGWTLVGHSFTANVSTHDDNKNMPSLRCGGGQWRPYDRVGAGAIDATDLVKASTEVAFSMSTTGGAVPTGPIGTYAYGYKFTIPDPSKVHFKNHSSLGPNTSTADSGRGPCVAVTVTGIQGTTFSGTRYTLQNVLGLSWSDTSPTGYGAGSTANCLAFDGGPFFPSIHIQHGSGSKTGVVVSECDVVGSSTYAYRGTYTDSTVNNTGSNAIWLR